MPVIQRVLEVQDAQETGAAAALGVLWAFSLLAAVAGWYLWYRARAVAFSAI